MLIVTRDGIKTEEQLVNEDLPQGGSSKVLAVPDGGADVDAVCGSCGAVATIRVVPGLPGHKLCSCGWMWAWQ